MSWFSKHVLPAFKRIKLKNVIGGAIAVIPAGGLVKAGVSAIVHAVHTGRDQVRRIAQAEGISEIEAAAKYAQQVDKAATAAATTQNALNSYGPFLIAGAVLVGIILLTRGRK